MDAGLLIFIVLWAGGIFLYFLPGLIAERRGHQAKVQIIVANLLLGWLLVPWVICLVWSLSAVVVPAAIDNDTIDCPFCAEPIRAAAIKCKHCGSILTKGEENEI